MKKRKVFISFLIFLFLFAEGIYFLAKFIGHQDTWRIVAISLFLSVCLFRIIVLAIRIFGKESKVS
jgi:hypothetical protein